jgi:predicted dehydrogenase
MAGPVEAVIAGCGNRGRDVFGAYALAHPDRLRIVAIAEPDSERRGAIASAHRIPAERAFTDWRELLDREPLAPVAIVSTSDMLHTEPALAALARGHHLLLEKPIAPTAEDCLRVVEAAEQADRMLQIGHVLRYTPFYQQVARVLADGDLGDLVNLDLKEHVAFWHMTHSYVRGKFRRRAEAAPLLLAKACHDLDLLAWFVGCPAERVASFGSLAHFRPEAAPQGAPERCSDGCPVQADCPHDAVAFYAAPDEKLARLWPWNDVSLDPSREARQRALETGRYGRCVYRCDNDVVDHQVVIVTFEGGVTATFTVQGLASEERRTLRITGTRGELRGVLHTGEIEVTRHGVLGTTRHDLGGSAFGHYGGDTGLLDHFTEVAASGRPEAVRASGRVSLESHLIGFAAEQARERGEVISMGTFRQEVGARAAAVAAGARATTV